MNEYLNEVFFFHVLKVLIDTIVLKKKTSRRIKLEPATHIRIYMFLIKTIGCTEKLFRLT